MKAIINLPTSDKMKAGKAIDLSSIRRIVEDLKICTLREGIDFVFKNPLNDMEEKELREVIIEHFKK